MDKLLPLGAMIFAMAVLSDIDRFATPFYLLQTKTPLLNLHRFLSSK